MGCKDCNRQADAQLPVTVTGKGGRWTSSQLPGDNKVLSPMSISSHFCVYVTTLLFEALSGRLWATQGCSSLQVTGPLPDRPTYFAIVLHQSNARLPGGPQMLWGQPGVKQVTGVDHEGRRIPDEITEELHVSTICAWCQGQWQ